MQDIRDYTVYPSNLDILSAFRRYKDFLTSRGYEEDILPVGTANYEMKISPHRTLKADHFNEFLETLARYPSSMPISMHSYWNKNKKYSFTNQINLSNSRLSVSVKSHDLDVISSVHDNIQYCFEASNPHQKQQSILSKYDLKKSVFLAHRFDEMGNQNSSSLLSFLSRLGFDVMEGSGYEARDIPDKVASKIERQDIFICLVTPGDSSWVLTEAAYAKGKNKYLIIICQEGTPFNKGIIGSDYEHIVFPENLVEKCFIDLLLALPL